MDFKVREKPRGSILGTEELAAVAEAIHGDASLSFDGPNLIAFENEFAQYCGVKHAIAVSNATVGLLLAAQILRLKKGDEVVMTPQTFKATALPMAARGCRVRFADIDETLNINPATIEGKITRKTRAIFVTDMNGNPVDMDPVMAIARRHNVPVVIDAAHSVGARYKDRTVGSIGDLTIFSFQSLKNMTTGGEGGMLTTNNDAYAQEAMGLRTMAVFGPAVLRPSATFGSYAAPDFDLKDHSDGAWKSTLRLVDEVGSNFRLSDIQAAIGRAQLRKLDKLNAQRLAVARRYDQAISGIKGLRVFRPTPDSQCVYHLYPTFLDRSLITASQHEVIKFLMFECGIEIIPRFWPVHLSRFMMAMGHRFGECPVCERIFFEEQLNLPISASITDKEVDLVIDALGKMSRRFARS
jgi:perosamine synthetase